MKLEKDELASRGYSNENISPVNYEVPVLIVGGGPVGLLLGHLLAKLDVRTLIVEKYPQRLAAPKAHVLSSRSLEICRQFSIDTTALRRLGTPRRDARWVNFCDTLSGESIGRLPFERMEQEVLEYTPEMVHNIPQPVFESQVAELLAKNPKTEVRKGLAFVSCSQNASSVTSVLEERSTGRRWMVRSQHVVGCDGAKSAVRSALDIPSEGEDSYETMMTIHFRADLSEVVKERVGMLHWCTDPAASGFIIGYDIKGDMVLISNFDQKLNPIESWTEEHSRKVVTAAIGRDVPLEVLSYRPWILSRKVAQQYRKGRIFLAGDAAHSFPPTGGLGLNCGLADAHNLACKLAALYHGQAGETLLDTYEMERRPVAELYSKQSAINGKKIFSFLKKLGTAGISDIETARANLQATIHDPAKQGEIAEGVEGQREHFSNLELHIGYVYGSKELPKNASDYTPKFRPGARLPHAWVRLPKSNLPPLDLSYVSELSKAEQEARQYSTLDLCQPDAFTLLVGKGFSMTKTQDVSSALSLIGIKLNVYIAGVNFEYCTESAESCFDIQRPDCGLLVRPDQHILACLGPNLVIEEVAKLIVGHLGIAPAQDIPC